MKKIGSCFKTGLVALLPFVLVALLIWKVWDLTAFIALPISSWPTLNTLCSLAIMTIAICLIGWLFQMPTIHKLLEILMTNLPIVSTLGKFIPNSDELAMLKGGQFKEGRAELFLGTYVRFIVIKTWEEQGVRWCRVYVASSPVPLSGYIMEMPENKIEYTGRNADDYFATVISFGLRSNKDQKPASHS